MGWGDNTVVDWEAVVDEFGPMVVRISWRILGRASDVEDNVQDAFLDAYRLHGREEIRHWRGLLRRLATVGALRRLRQRRDDLSLEDVPPVARADLPDEQAIGRELEAMFREAVDSLPEREGAVFTLRYFESLSLAEIAQSLGITYQAAATALSRARAKLESVFSDSLTEKN